MDIIYEGYSDLKKESIALKSFSVHCGGNANSEIISLVQKGKFN